MVCIRWRVPTSSWQMSFSKHKPVDLTLTQVNVFGMEYGSSKCQTKWGISCGVSHLSCYPLISISVLDTFYLIVVAPCVRITLKMCRTACGCVTMPSVFGYRIRPSPCYVEGCLGVLVIWCLLFLPKHPLTLLLCSLWSPGVSRPVATNCM